MCGVPTARMHGVTVAKVDTAVRGIERAGRRPVLLVAHQRQLKPYRKLGFYQDGTVRKVMTLNTRMDQQIFLGKPRTTVPLVIIVWMWEQTR